MTFSQQMSDNPITQIDITNLRARKANWKLNDQEIREEKNKYKPPPAKKIYLQEHTEYDVPKIYVRECETKKIVPIPVEIETGCCYRCDSMVLKGVKYCGSCDVNFRNGWIK